MSFLYSALVGDVGTKLLQQQQPPQQSARETIDKLCDRLVSATLVEDRRAAVLGLKGLSRDYQLDVGTKGMPILLHLLQTEADRLDPDTVKAILDTLINLCDNNNNSGNSGGGGATAGSAAGSPAKAPPASTPPSAGLGLQFTEIFVKDAQNVTVLLALLGEPDFNIKYNAVELLKILLRNKRKALQDCILTSPMGVSRLMDLLADRQEAIRNEGLLLLIDLTHNNPDIQKIIAFENAFERLLQIVYQEDACDGDMTIEDCLHLIYNLLKDNVSNQNYFRESGMMAQLAPFFKLPEMGGGGDGGNSVFGTRLLNAPNPPPWPRQKVNNVRAMLDIVKILTAPGNANQTANQSVIFKSKLLLSILQLGLARDVPAIIRTASLFAVSHVISENREVQDYLGKCVIQEGLVVSAEMSPSTAAAERSLPVAVLYDMIRSAVDDDTKGKLEFCVRAACAAVVQSFLSGNPDGQGLIASTFTPPPPSNPNDDISNTPQSAGNLLITALLDWDASRKDPFRSWFASLLLSHVISGNTHCKQTAMNLHVPDRDGDMTLDFLSASIYGMMGAARETADLRVIVGFMMFLSTWFHDFPVAVKHFLSESSNFPFLIEHISQASVDPLIQGLAAFLLGICFEYNDDSVTGFARSAIQSIVISRVGADQYINRFNRLKDSPQFLNSSFEAEFNANPTAESPTQIFFDLKFIDFFKSNFETLQKAVVNPNSLKQREIKKEEAKQQADAISSYKTLIASQDQEINQLKAKVAALEKQLAQQHHQPPSSHAANGSLKSPIPNGTNESSADTSKELLALRNDLEFYKQECEMIQRDLEDSLVCIGEQGIEIKKMRQRLRELGEVIEDDDDEDEQ